MRRMSRETWVGVVLLGCSLFGSTALQAQSPEPEREREREFQQLAAEVAALEGVLGVVKKAVRLVKPSVVHIEARKGSPEGTTQFVRRKPIEEAGSGVVIERGGRIYILTNRHVIRGAELKSIKVQLHDGRIVYPTRVWEDSGTDVAVMQIAETGLSPARIGDSSQLEIGDCVLAIGSPFGLSHSVTSGIISAKGRRDLQLGDDGLRYQDFLQTDAAINPGNSGGPLVNLRGEVIGLNTAIASASGGNEGIGFTIPINMAMHIAGQLVDRGTVTRAFLGVHLNARFGPDIATRLGLPQARGAHVTGTTPKSPAELARLQADDVVMEYNGTAVENDSHLVNLVSLTPVGSEVPLSVFRSGQVMTIRAVVGDRAAFDARQ